MAFSAVPPDEYAVWNNNKYYYYLIMLHANCRNKELSKQDMHIERKEQLLPTYSRIRISWNPEVQRPVSNHRRTMSDVQFTTRTREMSK